MELPRDDEHSTCANNTYTIIDNSRNDNSRHQFGDNHYTHNHYYPPKGLSSSPKRPQDRLKDHVSHGALHNSAERGPHAPKCFPETRVAVQQEMTSWMKHGRRTQEGTAPKVPQQILWLSGPAGSGKTAIMGTIADECHEEGSLAAGFFFSSFAGHSDRSSKRFFVTTLVYQLVQHDIIAGYSDEVSAALDRDPLIFKRDLQAQIDALILTPLRNVSARSAQETWPQLFLVDGLDECAGEEEPSQGTSYKSKGEVHQEILSILIRASRDPAFPFRIIIASRPERAIQGFLADLPSGTVKGIFLDSRYSPKQDMELYTRAMLTKIGMDFGLAENWYTQTLPQDWPDDRSRDVPSYLAEEASEQFVYVATIIRYVKDGSEHPHEKLTRALNWRRTGVSTPFSALDALYSGILQTSPDPKRAAMWMRMILTYGRHEEMAWYLAGLLESFPGETVYILGPLSSLIWITEAGGELDIHFYHKSLSDFLGDPQRSGDLYISNDQCNHFESSRYSAVLKNRGPFVPLPTIRTLDAFMGGFCSYLTQHDVFPPAHNHYHNASDIDWWLSYHHLAPDALRGVIRAFTLVHDKCRWYACRPACKMWRKCILRFAKAKGWHVPTVRDLLRDRFKHIPSDSDDAREVSFDKLLGPLDDIARDREAWQARFVNRSKRELWSIKNHHEKHVTLVIEGEREQDEKRIH